jgi:DNA-binding response OmpR family regulator
MSQTILIIEDEKVMRDVLADRIKKEGFTVLEAENGTTGLHMALDSQPDLIILDNRMPEMGGYQMLKTLREKNNWGAGVPVIFFTNVGLTADAEADIDAINPAHYLIKSDTSMDMLVAKIRELLRV